MSKLISMYLGLSSGVLQKDKYDRMQNLMKEKVNNSRWDKITKQIEVYKVKQEQEQDEKSNMILEIVKQIDNHNWQNKVDELVQIVDHQKYLKVLIS